MVTDIQSHIGLGIMNMFELGNWDLYTEDFMGSRIYYIDNFYKYPELVRKFTLEPLPDLWKVDTAPNGCLYWDRRLQARIIDSQVEKNYEILSQLINQRRSYKTDGGFEFISNVTRYLKHSYNDIERYNWWPHCDGGYNAIITLNNEFDDEYSGTALYHPDDKQTPREMTSEGVNPWIDKSVHRLVKDIKAKYNRCVLFDGKLFPHAMLINDYRFFEDIYRVNQVLFFEPHD
jgi:hypothetical protein